MAAQDLDGNKLGSSVRKGEQGIEYSRQGGMTKEELDERNVKARQLAGSSVEIVTDSGPEREQTVAVRSLPTMHESPEQFRQRVENEEE